MHFRCIFPEVRPRNDWIKYLGHLLRLCSAKKKGFWNEQHRSVWSSFLEETEIQQAACFIIWELMVSPTFPAALLHPSDEQQAGWLCHALWAEFCQIIAQSRYRPKAVKSVQIGTKPRSSNVVQINNFNCYSRAQRPKISKDVATLTSKSFWLLTIYNWRSTDSYVNGIWRRV